jgi:hypothetical protein
VLLESIHDERGSSTGNVIAKDETAESGTARNKDDEGFRSQSSNRMVLVALRSRDRHRYYRGAFDVGVFIITGS